jgi:hypothetical protein
MASSAMAVSRCNAVQTVRTTSSAIHRMFCSQRFHHGGRDGCVCCFVLRGMSPQAHSVDYQGSDAQMGGGVGSPSMDKYACA